MKIKHLLIGMLAMAGAVACKQDEPVATPELKVDKEAVTLTATAGEATFNVTSNQDWTATADADWVSLEPASGAASENAVAVKVTAEDNEATEARTATVTVKAGELTKTVALTQAGTEATPEPELPTPNVDWTSDKVVSYDLPESASSKRQLLKNIKYTFDENYFYVKLQASVAEFEAAPAEYLGVFVYDVVDGSGDGYYGWWNDAKGNTELEGEHIGVFSGKDITLTIGETPVEVTTEENGDELVWTLNILRSAHPNLALENPYFAFLTYIGWEPNGALPDKYENMLQFTPAPAQPEPEPEPEPTPEYELEGKQWYFSTMGVLVDLGLYEEDVMVVAVPLADGSGFGAYMYGPYEIEKTDATSGKIIFTQYDPEWDEFMDPVEYPYSELSENLVMIGAEPLTGDPAPLPFVALEEPFEIVFEEVGGADPVGPIENGQYWFFNGTKVMAPLAEGTTTGTLPAGNVINGASTEKNIFTLMYDPDWSYYTIMDSYGRFLGQTDDTGNITVTDVLPTDDTYAFYLWCVEPGYGEATSIYNAAYYYDFTYSSTENKWVLVDGGYETPEILPTLVKAENPVEEPVEPEGPKAVTVAEFLAAAEDDTVYELTGVITSVANTTYGNFYLKDETGEVYIYGLCSPEGASKYWAASGAKVGDTITVQTVRTSYNGSPQGKNAIFVSLVPCEPEPEPELPEGSTVASVVMKDLGYANAASVAGKSIALDENVTIVFSQGKSSNAPAYYDSGEAIRMYQNGATLDVTANGKTITSIEITFANNHYYVGADCGELSAEAPVRTWTGSAEAVKFTSTGTDKNHRAYVSAIKVIYE